MNDILHEHLAAGHCVCYSDDLLICTVSDNPAKHLLKLTAVLDTLWEHDLLIKGSKSERFHSQVEFLRFKHLHSFLGMTNFFSSFMTTYSKMTAPLKDLLKASSGAQKVNWTVECETAFNLIKSTLTSAPVFRHCDPALRTAVHVDGSQNTVGAVLLQ